MMTQSVMTQAAVLSRNLSSAYTSKVSYNASGFDQVMNNNLKSSDASSTGSKASGAKKSIQTKESKPDTKAADDREAMKTAWKKSNSKEDAEVKDKTDAGENKAKTVSEAVQPEDAKSKTLFNQLKEALYKAGSDDGAEEEIPADGQKKVLSKDEIMAQILNLLQNVQAKVMDMLKLSPEELNSFLDSQGLDITELTDQEVLKQLVLKSSGKSDVLDFLTDGDLAQTLKELVEQVEALKEQMGQGITTEQLKAAIQVLTGQEEITPEAAVTGGTDLDPQEKKAATDQKNLSEQTETEDSIDGKPEVEVIKFTEAGSGTGETKADDNKSQTQDKAAAKQYETFLDNLTSAVNEMKTDFMGEEARAGELKAIANQIIERIRVIIKPEQTSMELQLNPENLGKVNLTVQSKAGAMTAHFTVQDEMAKEAIEGQLQLLKDTLQAQGIKVEAIEVTVSSYTFSQDRQPDDKGQAAGQDKNRSRKLSLEDAISMNEEPEPERATDITGLSGSNIDMTA